MRTLSALLFVLTLLVPSLHAQCGIIVDGQHLFDATDKTNLEEAALQLSSEHALPHVLTLDIGQAGSLDDAVVSKQNECPDWHVSGVRANNIIIFAVDAHRRKAGIFYGARFHDALDSHYSDIVKSYMAPHFRDREWTAGLIEGMQQTASQLRVANAPKTNGTVVLDTPTDWRPIVHFLFWFLGIVVLLIIAAFVIRAWRRRKADAEEIAAHRAKAKDAYNWAGKNLNEVRDWLSTKKAAGDMDEGTFTSYTALLDAQAENFTRAVNSYNIETGSAQEAALAYTTYNKIATRVEAIRAAGSPAQPRGSHWKPNIPSSASIPSTTSTRIPEEEIRRQADAAYARRTTQTQAPAPQPQPIVVERGGTDPLVAGMFGYELGRNSSSDEDRPVHRRRDDDDDSSRSSSSYGGGYSSSSSDSGGGSSSDFGSSDSGGGGGSDFGSSDSGGGGSDSF